MDVEAAAGLPEGMTEEPLTLHGHSLAGAGRAEVGHRSECFSGAFSR